MHPDQPVMHALDLIVTTDTANSHLAGAMGLEVWMATPYIPDWRWLLDREDSPWYPAMRLFRQPARDRWDVVFERLAEALRTEAFRKRLQS